MQNFYMHFRISFQTLRNTLACLHSGRNLKTKPCFACCTLPGAPGPPHCNVPVTQKIIHANKTITNESIVQCKTSPHIYLSISIYLYVSIYLYNHYHHHQQKHHHHHHHYLASCRYQTCISQKFPFIYAWRF